MPGCGLRGMLKCGSSVTDGSDRHAQGLDDVEEGRPMVLGDHE